jgi:hypothetical protein
MKELCNELWYRRFCVGLCLLAALAGLCTYADKAQLTQVLPVQGRGYAYNVIRVNHACVLASLCA